MIRVNILTNAPSPFAPVVDVYTGPSLLERASRQLVNVMLVLTGAYFVIAILLRLAD